MKVWEALAMCLLLVISVSARPLYRNLHPANANKSPPPSSYSSSSRRLATSGQQEDQQHHNQHLLRHREEENTPEYQHQDLRVRGTESMEEQQQQYDLADPYPEQYDDVMDFIEATIGRLRRSSETGAEMRARRERQARERGGANTGGGGGGGGHRDKRKGRGRGGSRGRSSKAKAVKVDSIAVQTRGCLLREVHLNVTDLGLGYRTKEEMFFRYCSGPCAEAETNYDKILNNLTHDKRLGQREAPSRTCCRPIAFDDDLSFLDDNVVYHTLKKHSARKCACV